MNRASPRTGIIEDMPSSILSTRAEAYDHTPSHLPLSLSHTHETIPTIPDARNMHFHSNTDPRLPPVPPLRIVPTYQRETDHVSHHSTNPPFFLPSLPPPTTTTTAAAAARQAGREVSK